MDLSAHRCSGASVICLGTLSHAGVLPGIPYLLGPSVLFLLKSADFLSERAVAMNMGFGATQTWIGCSP